MQLLNEFSIHMDMVRFGVATPKWSKSRFPYPHHRLYYVLDGEATLKLNDSVHILKPGYIYLIPAFSMVETICHDHMDHYYIHFRLHQRDIIDVFQLYEPNFEVLAMPEAEAYFKQIEAHYENDGPYSSMIAASAFYALLAPFFKNCVRPSSEIMRFDPVLNYIEHNLDSKLSSKELASIIDLDPVYFANLFSKTFLMPPSQYVIKKRLELAQTLLITSSMKVKDIAAKAGIDNPMYFSKLFKEKIGLTPGAYRKHHSD